MVGDRHELGKGRSSQDGVVGGLELGDLEVDVLGAVVVTGAEGDRQGGPADRGRPGSEMMPYKSWSDGTRDAMS